jgi:ferredoxin
MSAPERLSRRSLLGLLRRAAPRAEPRPAPRPPPAAEPLPPERFSLESFYRTRAAATAGGAQGLPAVVHREGLEFLPATRVGVPELATARPASPEVPSATPRLDGSAWVARVRESTCLAWQGSFCTVCSEHCPVKGALLLELGRPRVEPAACTGCGACIQVCPAPINALLLEPRPAPAVAKPRSSETS